MTSEQENLDENKKLRTIRSFVRRTGRLTTSQNRALETLWPKYGVEPAEDLIQFKSLFNNDNPVVLEVGFGNGKSFVQQAANTPAHNFLGIEVHKPGVGSCLKDVAALELANVKLMCADAVEILKNNIAEHSLQKVQLFFPDPWHKKRHHKRRIVQPSFVDLLVSRLKPGGCLHFATDWEPYAEQMLEVLSENEKLVNLSDSQDFVPRPDARPLTKFEARGHRLGHGVWDLMFLVR